MSRVLRYLPFSPYLKCLDISLIHYYHSTPMVENTGHKKSSESRHLPLFIYILSGIIPLMSLILVVTYLKKGYEDHHTKIRTLLILAAIEPLILLFAVLFIIKFLT